jgi:GalNAc5-diNAcBac-PP-undecaprenol beta-1,3-glucosyltransferase
MSLAATVLVPTHSHGRLLGPAVRSALAQTVQDLEVLVVGDGPTEETRACARALAASDARVQYHEFEKGERHGELHRHRVLTDHARGDAVLYLSDDDLWFEDHAERLLGLLGEADFAHALSCWLLPDGRAQATILDVAKPFHREAVRSGVQTPSLTVAGHTMAAYRRLPHGWRTTPAEVSTDSWMWRQFLDQDWVRAASGTAPTVVHLPSPVRKDWSLERRMAELEGVERSLTDPAWRVRFAELVLAGVLEEGSWLTEHDDHLQRWGTGLERKVQELWDDRAIAYERRDALQAMLSAEVERRTEAERLLADRDERLAGVLGSRTWRLRNALRGRGG